MKHPVFFDNQIFIIQKYGGSSRYFVDLFHELDIHHREYKINGVFSISKTLKEIKNNGLIYIHIPNIKGFKPFIEFINKIFSFICLFRKQKITHHTYYDKIFQYSNSDFHVLTVYDMIHEKFNLDPTIIKNKKYCMDRADKIIAISESTKNDILEYYPIDPDKIEVIYLSSNLKLTKVVSNPLFEKKYILYIGTRRYYKNFDKFLLSIAPLLKEHDDVYLICGGGKKFSPTELELINANQISNRVLWHEIKDDDFLANLYHHALFFVFPSLYEGFGVPILEAFNCECPVVLSDSSSLKEIADNAGLYFDPTSEESIYNTCKLALENESLRKEMIQKGNQRKLDFSRKMTFEKTWKLYEDLIINQTAHS